MQSFLRRDTFVLKIQRELYHPKCGRKVSRLSRNGPCFSKISRTFRARKASCQTAIRLFWKADLWTCFYCKKNQEDCEVWWLRISALRIYKGSCGTRNRPEKFRDFCETVPWCDIRISSKLVDSSHWVKQKNTRSWLTFPRTPSPAYVKFCSSIFPSSRACMH